MALVIHMEIYVFGATSIYIIMSTQHNKLQCSYVNTCIYTPRELFNVTIGKQESNSHQMLLI